MSTISQIEEIQLSPLHTGSLPAVALGGGVTLSAVLGLLHASRITTFAVADAGDIAGYSRWYRPLPGCGSNPKPADLEELLGRSGLDSAVLVPCADDWLRAVASLPTKLARRFPSSTAPVMSINLMTNKWRFAQLLERLQIPHPKTWLVRSRVELSGLPESEFENAILKPLSSVEFARKYGRKGFLVHSRTEALSRMEGIEYPILLQEFIPGAPSTSFFLDGFVDAKGRLRAGFARQRLRMHPPNLGNSTLMISIPIQEVRPVLDDLRTLFVTTAYRGAFNAEFKFDARDSRFKLIEINARPWWYIEFAARCGIDVCSMMYGDALGVPVSSEGDYRVGCRCVLAMNDLLGWRHSQNGGGSLFSWLRPWWGAESALFHWSDPGPGFAYGWRILKQWIWAH